MATPVVARLISMAVAAAVIVGCVSPSASSSEPTSSALPATTTSASMAATIPLWCGGESIGPPLWQGPHPTPDPRHLLCLAAENKSEVPMWLAEGPEGGSLIPACEGMAASSGKTGRWSLEVGARASPTEGGIAGPVLARFDSSELTGDAPFLIEVVINPDLSATISQRASLPEDPTRTRYC